MIQFTPLLADMETLIGIAVFVIVTLASVFSNYLTKQREQQAGRRPRREAGPVGEIRAGGQQGEKPVALEDEIGEFLRRAARGDVQRPAQQPRPAQQTRPQRLTRPAQAGLPPRPAQARPKPRQPQRPRVQVQRRVQPPVAAEIIEPARPPVGKGLSEQVARDINTAEIARRTSQLGKETRQATAKLDQEIHETFDHKVGNLQSRAMEGQPDVTETASGLALPATSAAGLSVLLSNTESLKQAIILNEILQRPSHRW
ncbi:MAG: hypothetical protein JXM70_17495 [Pirellulales bacterium]|nr:hypothetical protein [Pirellulales bacterium]